MNNEECSLTHNVALGKNVPSYAAVGHAQIHRHVPWKNFWLSQMTRGEEKK